MRSALIVLFVASAVGAAARPQARHDLLFPRLPAVWDEGLPLGNGCIGALVWERDGRLRVALDRADLWDLRPMANRGRTEFSFAWVGERVRSGDYRPVQEMFDLPYDSSAGPTKIPAAALEFSGPRLGPVASARLRLRDALATVLWENGASLTSFVHATEPVGWFRFEGVDSAFLPEIVPPRYRSERAADQENALEGQNLSRLGYTQGKVEVRRNRSVYRQVGWNGFAYTVAVTWKRRGSRRIDGVWSITSSTAERNGTPGAERLVATGSARGWDEALRSHRRWWEAFWARSSVTLPDTLLERQWFLEQYKFGAAARRGAPPVSLQAVWTADNGRLPPWKGDLHHDLNTQLSYWPCYSGNHLEEGLGFLDWLWRTRPAALQYTREYFATSGLNVPGVTTLAGEPMGGWIQYSFSPTISCWLAQHFYLHWRYSMDRRFLAERAYPYLSAVARHVAELAVRDSAGRWMLPLSSSPEFHDNRLEAWFPRTTNYDLALVRWTLRAAAGMADELGKRKEAQRWRTLLAGWPDLAVDTDSALMVAPGHPYAESHRHFSHMMAIHPLGLVNWSDGERSRSIIRASLRRLDALGADWWVGYSYSWLGILKARARDGDGAARALRTFAACFCLPNSFHANGDQSRSGRSKFTYRPFTLEGNFAFAAGVQEMLLQSHDGVIRVFPAVPRQWRQARFDALRAEGAFLVSAQMAGGRLSSLRIRSEAGGRATVEDAFAGRYRVASGRASGVSRSGSLLRLSLARGEEILLAAEDAASATPRRASPDQ